MAAGQIDVTVCFSQLKENTLKRYSAKFVRLIRVFARTCSANKRQNVPVENGLGFGKHFENYFFSPNIII